MEKTLNEIRALFDEFIVDARKAADGNMAAGKRARKASLELDKLLKDFRRESVGFKRGRES